MLLLGRTKKLAQPCGSYPFRTLFLRFKTYSPSLPAVWSGNKQKERIVSFPHNEDLPLQRNRRGMRCFVGVIMLILPRMPDPPPLGALGIVREGRIGGEGGGVAYAVEGTAPPAKKTAGWHNYRSLGFGSGKRGRDGGNGKQGRGMKGRDGGIVSLIC